ncbi:hypothetical protein V6N13_044721 [Hibiscus sabdariffa]
MPPDCSDHSPCKVLFANLKRLKLPLRQFNKEYFGEVSHRVLTKQLELENVQRLLLRHLSGDLIAKEKALANELRALSLAEEKFFKQKSRVQHFFTEQLGTVDGHVSSFSDDLLEGLLGMKLTSEMQDSLVAPVSHKQLRLSYFQ